MSTVHFSPGDGTLLSCANKGCGVLLDDSLPWNHAGKPEWRYQFVTTLPGERPNLLESQFLFLFKGLDECAVFWRAGISAIKWVRLKVGQPWPWEVEKRELCLKRFET